jgi:hypothetical protein
MSTTATSKAPGLTEYEAEQVKRIAAWKAEPPNPFSEMFKRMTYRGARFVERLIPDRFVATAIHKAYDASDRLAGQEDIKRRAGVSDLSELFHKPLEECDRLAAQVGRSSRRLALVEGAATGAGGVLTTLLDVPLLFFLAMRTIIKMGHCYGYPLDRPNDRRFVLTILVIAASGSLERKHKALSRLRDVEDWLLEETQEEIITEEAAAILFQLELFEEVPGLGVISGGLLNYGFVRKVELTAKRIFQEHWLHDTGKVATVEPAPLARRVAQRGRWGGVLTRAAHSSCYGVGFGVALPVYMLMLLVPGRDNALARGIRDGAAAASNGVKRMLERGEHRAATPPNGAAVAPA